MLSLIVLQGPGKGKVFRFLGDKPVVLGRQGGDLRLLDTKVSRRHAEINFEAGTWVIRDLGSSNGTFVNGRRIDALTELEEGDQLTFGAFVLVVGQLTHEAPTMGDTSLVDAESMDHVMLSPHVPTTDRARDEDDDVMHVEPVPHAERPESPAAPPAPEVEPASMFDLDAEPLDATVPVEDADAQDTDEPVALSGLVAEAIEALDEAADEADAWDVDALDDEAEEPEEVAGSAAPDLLDKLDAAAETGVAAAAPVGEPELEPEAVAAEPDVEPPVEPLTEAPTVAGAAPVIEAAAADGEPEAADDAAPPVRPTGAALHDAALIGGEADFGLDELDRIFGESEVADDAGAAADVSAADAAPRERPAPLPEVPYNLLGSLKENPFELFDAYVAGEANARPAPRDTAFDADARFDSDAADAGLDDTSFGLDAAGDDAPADRQAIDDFVIGVHAESPPPEAPEVPEAPETPQSLQNLDAARGDDADEREPAGPSAPLSAARASAVVVAPRRKRKSRLLWPLTGAVVLLLAAGGAVYFSYFAAGLPANSAPLVGAGTSAAPVPAAPVPPLPDLADGSLPPPAKPRPAAPPPDEPINPVTMSMLDDGPTLVGRDVPPPRIRIDDDRVPATPPPRPVPAAPPIEAAPEPQIAPEPPQAVEAEPAPPSVAPPAPVAAGDAFNPRHVAYLVDASGSLLDTLPQVLIWLDEAIRQIDPATQYTIIFFRAGEVVEVPPTGLKPADDRLVNRDVRRWIAWDTGNVIPAGRSDPRNAIEQVLDYGVGQIYILSDGHVGDRLSDQQIADFMLELDDAVGPNKLAVHSIQFFYAEMNSLLTHLSRRFPGRHQFIEPERPSGDGFDGLSAIPR